MIDARARPGSYLRLMLLIALLGVVSAGITFAFVTLLHEGFFLIWERAWPITGLDERIFTLLVCTTGGVLVGLLLKLFGDHNAIFADLMAEFGKTGRFDYKAAPGIVITAVVSMLAGGSLGPEAPLADLCGGLGTWLADKFKYGENERRALGYGGFSAMLASLITNPFGGALLGLETAHAAMAGMEVYFWSLFPSLLASAAAAIVYVQLSGAFFGKMYTFPQYSPRLLDLVMAVPLSLLGAVMGLGFMLGFRRLDRLLQPLKGRPVLRATLGGLSMGIIGALLPLTLFSGERQAPDLILRSAQLGIGMLIVLAIAKLMATAILLATGWKGGYIFPIMFAGVALGEAASLAFPGIPMAVTVAATLTGAFVAAIRAPLFAALFTLVLVQAETGPVVAVAVIVSSLLSALIAMMQSRELEPSEKPSTVKMEA